jgi:hypothetical protein
MIPRRRSGLAAAFCCALLASIPSAGVLAAPAAGSKAVEFRFHDRQGTEHVAPVDRLYFHISLEGASFVQYGRRSVYDPETWHNVDFREMKRFTIKKGADGYLVVFEMPGEPGTRTLPFLESEKFTGDEYVPEMFIRFSNQAKIKHERILLDDVVWPIEVKR